MKNPSLTSRTYLAFGTAVALLAVSGLISYRTTRSSMASAAWVDHTYEVLTGLGSLRATIADAQSSRRGYVLTGDAASFRQFEDAAATTVAKLNEVQALTRDNPNQVRRIVALRQATATRLGQMRDTMEERRAHGFDQARQAQLTEQGRSVQRRVNDGISEMEQEEKDLLRGRQGASNRSQTTALVVITSSSVLALLIVFLALQRIRAELRDRLRAEQSVLQANTLMRAVFDASTETSIIATDPRGVITVFNTGAEKMLGYAAEEMVGRQTPAILNAPPETAPDGPRASRPELSGFETVIERVRQSGREIGERTYLRKDGSGVPVRLAVTAIRGEDQELSGFLGVAVDISEARKNERMKNEFVSIVSHELRTPLTSIRGALGLLAGGLLKQQPEKQQRMLDIAITNTDRLVRLINDILDIERMESGKTTLRNEVCDAGQIMSLAAETMQAMAAKSQLRIDVAPQAISFRADPDRILQVLSNLLSNAIKFSPPERVILVSAAMSGEQVRFEVRDEGRGIPADKLEAIFERFQQVDASDAREKGGTGLGLPICRAIAQQHGGRIWAESTVGEGSRFFLSIPLGMRAESVVPVRAAIRTVLVCDDEESNRAAIAALLEQRGYRALLAASGPEAIEMATRERPDAVLLDLVMPGMDGWQTLQGLKEHAESRNIPILILEVAAGPEPVTATSVERLAKPLDEERLLEWLARAARSHEATRVLIVEDDLDLARVLVGLFERRGIEVFHAGTGKAAIELSERVEPDLLVLDLILPEGDGFSVVDWLRRNDKLRSVPLVVYTAKDLTADEREKLKLGHTEFITKSRMTLPEFEERIFRLLDALTKQRNGTPPAEESEATFHGS